MTTYGYARVSTNGQDLTSQEHELLAAGCSKVFKEKVSGAKTDRAELAMGFDDVHRSLNEIQSQNWAILSHLGLPDPVEEKKAREAEAYAKRKAERERALKEAPQTIERAGFDKKSDTTDSKDGEKK